MKEVRSGRIKSRPSLWRHKLVFAILLAPSGAIAHDTLDFNGIQGIFTANCGGGERWPVGWRRTWPPGGPVAAAWP